MNAQEIVAANVAARGYRDGWTAEQFVARQLAKLTEELGEALDQIGGIDKWADMNWLTAGYDAGLAARQLFDDKRGWGGVYLDNADALRAELADMQVVLFAAAQTLEFDIAQAAIDKSGADVERGVR
jgi:NTP pyrophosphatase (non-canonical NTP hydrolase)